MAPDSFSPPDFSLWFAGQPFSPGNATSRRSAAVGALGGSAGGLLASLAAALPIGGPAVSRPLEDTGHRSGKLSAELWALCGAQPRGSRTGSAAVGVALVQLPGLGVGRSGPPADSGSLLSGIGNGAPAAAGVMAGVSARRRSQGGTLAPKRLDHRRPGVPPGDGADRSSPAATASRTASSARLPGEPTGGGNEATRQPAPRRGSGHCFFYGCASLLAPLSCQTIIWPLASA